MNPQNHRNSHFDYFNDLIKGDNESAESHRKFYDEYNAVLDMDADYYLETIATVFQDFKLVNGTWDVKNLAGEPERVTPADIKTSALLTVEGELDDISGSGQTKAAHDLCRGISKSKQQHFEAKGAGHYGIFSGRRWREQVYPQVRDFILAHHVAPKAAAIAAAEVVTEAVAEVVVKATPKVTVKPVTATKTVSVQKPQSKVKTTWVATPKK
jgi:poly(3-hydroxybutyrate) depolymerase